MVPLLPVYRTAKYKEYPGLEQKDANSFLHLVVSLLLLLQEISFLHAVF